MTGASVKDARVIRGSDMDIEQAGKPVISFEVKADSVRLFSQITRRNRGVRMAIILDDIAYSAPVIQAHITDGRSVITGMEDQNEANTLAIAIRSGALPAEVELQEQRFVGPSLGSDSVHQGMMATLVGGALVIVFMLLYYPRSRICCHCRPDRQHVSADGVPGVSGGHSWTLPGVAGLILTIGMAIDANVLIFERIREELATGKTGARRHRGRLRSRRVGHLGCQHHDVHHGGGAVPVRYRSGPRFRAHSGYRYLHERVLGAVRHAAALRSVAEFLLDQGAVHRQVDSAEPRVSTSSSTGRSRWSAPALRSASAWLPSSCSASTGASTSPAERSSR